MHKRLLRLLSVFVRVAVAIGSIGCPWWRRGEGREGHERHEEGHEGHEGRDEHHEEGHDGHR